MDITVNERKKFTTTLNAQIIEDIKIQAIKESTDVSKLLEKLIIQYLKEVELIPPQKESD